MKQIKNTLTYILTPISNSYWSVLEKSVIQIGLHSGQVFILISLLEQDGQSQIELSKNLNVAPPTVNKMVKALTANGFIKMSRGQNDGRIVRAFLTEKGSNCQNLIEEKWMEIESILLGGFTETEKLILFQLFEKLQLNLNDDQDSE